MLREIERGVQNGSITKNGVLPVVALFFWKFCFSIRTTLKSWLDVPITKLSTIILFVSVGVLFEGVFPQRVFLRFHKCQLDVEEVIALVMSPGQNNLTQTEIKTEKI